MVKQYKRLIENLNAFTRKYYYNLLIRGGLYTIAITLGFFLIFDLAEYFFYLPKIAKMVLLLIYFAVTITTLVVFIFIPALRLLGIIPKISDEEAARIIGNHFPDIQDKLLNTLQLYKLKEKVDNDTSIRLLNASIETRALKLSPISFKRAINFSVNKKHLKWALPPFLVFVVLMISSPTVIYSPAERFINFDSTYIPPPPFDFILENSDLRVEEGKDFLLKLKVEGSTVPEDIMLNMNGFEYLMQKKSPVSFSYRIKNVKKPVEFYFRSGKFRSKLYHLELLNTPKILNVKVRIHYPSYIGRNDETAEDMTDMNIPEGSELNMEVVTKNAAKLLVNKNGDITEYSKQANGEKFIISQKRIRENTVYRLIPQNENIIANDTLIYDFRIIKDEYPGIRVREYTDSVFEKQKFFKGYIKDDYGFTTLYFEVNFKSKTGKDSVLREKLPLAKGVQGQEFLYSFDLGRLNFIPGSAIDYSFVVFDNDAVNGPKKSRSRKFVYETKTKEEEIASADKRDEEMQKSVDASVKKAEEISRDLQRISDKLKSKKNLSWDDKKEIREVLKKYEELQKEIEKQKEEKKLNELKDAENNLIDEELKKKQDELNKLMDELMTPEMKELLEKMREMMEKNVKKDDVEKAIDEMKMDSEFLKKQLERDLELMKQLKFDQKLQQAIDKIDELQKKQEELSEKAKNRKTDIGELKKQQDSLNREFENFRKMMEEARKVNSELSEPNKMENTKPEESDIQNDMQKSSEGLSKGKKKSAASNQKSASQKMKSLSKQLQMMQAQMESRSDAEDMENLKNIMENLIEISFNQEELMNKVKHTSNRDPKFPEFVDKQKRIARDLQMVEDSLMKLARRNPSVSPYINREISKIKNYSDNTFLELKELNTIGPVSSRQMTRATANQQFIMTSVNNLALMLSEVLDQMKKQQMQKSGKGSCSKPKPGSGGQMKTMRQMQQALQKQMEQMKKQMEKQAGKSQGKQKNGGKQQQNGEQMSEEFAKMAAQQEAIRKKLNEYREKLAKEGKLKQAGQLGKIADEMDKNETDLVNKILTEESLMRQKEILTRLLESEKAEREREQEEERKSKEGKNVKKSNKIYDFEYKKPDSEDIELLRLMPPELRPFYKKLVESYFDN